MSEYVVHEENWLDGYGAGYPIICYSDSGKPVGKTIEDFINAQADELASLQQANMDLLALMEAQSEKLGEARRVVKDIANSLMPEKEANQAMLWRALIRDAQWQVAQWESEAMTTESEAE